MRRPHPPRTAIERDIVEAEGAVRDFASKNPDTVVTVIRFANGLGPSLRTSHTAYLESPLIPTILGFDPRYQFIYEDDMAACLEHAVRHDVHGIFNCAADGVLALSEVISLLGHQNLPVLPPVGTSLVSGQVLRRLGIRIAPEMLPQLRFGRGLDNRAYKASGFRYRYTTREAVLKLREHQRLHPLMREQQSGYRYESAVEEFLRFSPSVRKPNAAPELPTNTPPRALGIAPTPRRPPSDYDDLDGDEVIALLPSLEVADLIALRDHEAANAGRQSVLRAIDGLLARR
jgi:UDP-glucose 4-epimerase